MWASATEIDATGKPVFGSAYFTISQIVPNPWAEPLMSASGFDNVPRAINYQLNVTGLM